MPPFASVTISFSFWIARSFLTSFISSLSSFSLPIPLARLVANLSLASLRIEGSFVLLNLIWHHPYNHLIVLTQWKRPWFALRSCRYSLRFGCLVHRGMPCSQPSLPLSIPRLEEKQRWFPEREQRSKINRVYCTSPRVEAAATVNVDSRRMESRRMVDCMREANGSIPSSLTRCSYQRCCDRAHKVDWLHHYYTFAIDWSMTRINR